MGARTDWVDYAKAIGIILVVYGHVARGLYNAGMHFPVNLYSITDSIIYSFHMPLFFFLSGLFFHHSFTKRGGFNLILNKLDTVAYPYFIWSILQGGTEALLSGYTNGNVTFYEVLYFWEPRAQFWFLYALFFVYAVSSAIYSLVSEKYITIIFILASLLYIFQSLLPDVPIFRYVSNSLVFFIFGILFNKYNICKRFSSSSLFPIILIFFIAIQYLFHGYLAKAYTDKGVESLFLACMSILFVVSLSSLIAKRSNRYFAFIGASSMAIYLMHILAGSGARIILSKVFGVDSTIIHLVIGCLVGILAPLMALRIINKVRMPYVFSAPVSKWLEFSYGKALQRTIR